MMMMVLRPSMRGAAATATGKRSRNRHRQQGAKHTVSKPRDTVPTNLRVETPGDAILSGLDDAGVGWLRIVEEEEGRGWLTSNSGGRGEGAQVV